MLWILAASSDVSFGDFITAFSAEQIFGGLVLGAVLWLIMSGRIRVEREINREREINALHEETIATQRQTIRALTEKDRETLQLLRQLRAAAVNRGDLKFSDMIHEQIGSEHD